MNTRLLIATVAALHAATLARADTVITIRVSVKVVLNPMNGSRPLSNNSPITDFQIDQMINGMNPLMASQWRGFRFQRVDPITNVGATQPVPYTPSRPDPSF